VSLLPEGFRFGVATCGFQVEGGHNGPGEPANNWADWEREGRVEPSGIAVDFWNRHEEHLDRVQGLGCDAFRLSVEWSRCEPAPGEVDDAAVEHYRRILVACRDRDLEPLVTLHHFTHPDWLGVDFWLDADSPERFAAWVGTLVPRLADLCTNWVTLNELNILSLSSYWLGAFPPGRLLKTAQAARAIDHLLTAHVLAYAEIHRIQPDAVVATNNLAMSAYPLDRMLQDVLLARLHGVEEAALGSWLYQRQAGWEAALGPAGPKERAVRALAAKAIPLGAASIPRTVDAVYASQHPCTQDVTQIDFYDPGVGHQLQAPFARTAGGRTNELGLPLWDQAHDADAFAVYTEVAVAPDREVWVVENGMCHRVRNGRVFDRQDGLTRPRMLREHLRALVHLVDRGVPVGAYYHWTLADNYEWGSYQPRFGLFGVDRERGTRILPTDAHGDDSAGAYRRLIEGLRADDRSVLA
jgi:beta-glucosidase/6-phospho-beta-glucosidase/beta-galactosidase